MTVKTPDQFSNLVDTWSGTISLITPLGSGLYDITVTPSNGNSMGQLPSAGLATPLQVLNATTTRYKDRITWTSVDGYILKSCSLTESSTLAVGDLLRSSISKADWDDIKSHAHLAGPITEQTISLATDVLTPDTNSNIIYANVTAEVTLTTDPFIADGTVDGQTLTIANVGSETLTLPFDKGVSQNGLNIDLTVNSICQFVWANSASIWALTWINTGTCPGLQGADNEVADTEVIGGAYSVIYPGRDSLRVHSDGGAATAGGDVIKPGVTDGQTLTLYGTSDTDYVDIPSSGNAVNARGATMRLNDGAIIRYKWFNSLWTEIGRYPVTDPVASEVSIEDAGDYYTSDNVEGALQEAASDTADVASDLSDHINDTTDAHDASAISTPAKPNLGGTTDVEAGLAALGTVAVKTLGSSSGNLQENGGSLTASKILATDASSKLVTTGIDATFQSTISDDDTKAPTSGAICDFAYSKRTTVLTPATSGTISITKLVGTYRVSGDGGPVTGVDFGVSGAPSGTMFWVEGTSDTNTVRIDHSGTVVCLHGIDLLLKDGDLSQWVYDGTNFVELQRRYANSTVDYSQTITSNGDTVYILQGMETITLSAASDYTGLILDTTNATVGQKIRIAYTGSNYVDLPASATTLNRSSLTMRLMGSQWIEYEFDGTNWVEQKRKFNKVSIHNRLSRSYVVGRLAPPILFDTINGTNSDHITEAVQYSLDCGTIAPGTFDTVVSSPNPNMTVSLVDGGSGTRASTESIVVTPGTDDVVITYSSAVYDPTPGGAGSNVSTIEALIEASSPLFVATPGTGSNDLVPASAFAATPLAGGSAMAITFDNYDLVSMSVSTKTYGKAISNAGVFVRHTFIAGGYEEVYDQQPSNVAFFGDAVTYSFLVSPGDSLEVFYTYSSLSDARIVVAPGTGLSCDSIL